MGKIDPNDERHLREMVERERSQFTLMFPELAVRPAEMRKMVEAMDALIMSWLATRPESAEDLERFFTRQISLAFNFYSLYVCAEFRELCEHLQKRYKNGTSEITEIERDGEKVEIESHMLDTIIVRRNMLAAYLGDELKCIDDYLGREEPSAPAAS